MQGRLFLYEEAFLIVGTATNSIKRAKTK